MPGGDGTGPMGLGPLSGRGAGFCRGYGTQASLRSYAWRRGGFGTGFASQLPPRAVPEEKTVLKHQAEYLKEQLGYIEKRLNEMNQTDEA